MTIGEIVSYRDVTTMAVSRDHNGYWAHASWWKLS